MLGTLSMRYFLWLLKFALFVLVLSFAVKNTDTVAVRYYLGYEWQHQDQRRLPLVPEVVAHRYGVGVLHREAQDQHEKRELQQPQEVTHSAA